MASFSKRVNFFTSDEGLQAKKLLKSMAEDNGYNTVSTYSANSERYPDNRISFVDKHMNYLNSHPAIDPNHYIANLRLMTKLR